MSHGLQATGAASARPGVLPWALSGFKPDAPVCAREAELDPAELRFRRLGTPADLRRIEHLRAEIQLPAATVTDPGFRAREKKEMRRAWSAHSNGVVASSGR